MDKYIVALIFLVPSFCFGQEAEINWFPQPTTHFQADAFGNQNYVTTYPGGKVVVSGYNPYNGATWNSQGDSRGASGIDANGNYWANSNNISPQQRMMEQNVQNIGSNIGRLLFEPRR